jgi:small subunit ribosomal protein S9
MTDETIETPQAEVAEVTIEITEIVEETPAEAPRVPKPGVERPQATGKRKTSIARVIVKRGGDGSITCNGRPIDEYFPRKALVTTGLDTQVSVVARLNGGGVTGQAGALRHGIARALVLLDESLRPDLKREGMLVRDARIKERKKAGLRGARKRPQFSKR